MYPHKCKERVTDVRKGQLMIREIKGRRNRFSRDPEMCSVKGWNGGRKLEGFGRVVRGGPCVFLLSS